MLKELGRRVLFFSKQNPLLWWCVHAQSLSCIQLFAIPWTIAHQAPLSIAFSRQAYWSESPYLPPRDLPDPRIEPVSPSSPALGGRFFTTEPPGNPYPLVVAGLIYISSVQYETCSNGAGLFNSTPVVVEHIFYIDVPGSQLTHWYVSLHHLRDRLIRSQKGPFCVPTHISSLSLPGQFLDFICYITTSGGWGVLEWRREPGLFWTGSNSLPLSSQDILQKNQLTEG